MRMDQERRSIWIIINIIVKDCMKIFLPREYPDMPSKRLFQLPPPVYFTWHYFHLKFVCMCRAKSYFKWIMSFLVFASRQRDTISTACKWREKSDTIVKSELTCCDPAQGRSGGRGRGRGCRPPSPSRSRRGWRSPPPSRSSRAGLGLPPGRRTDMEAGAGAGRLNEVLWYILSTIKMRHYNSLLSITGLYLISVL